MMFCQERKMYYILACYTKFNVIAMTECIIDQVMTQITIQPSNQPTNHILFLTKKGQIFWEMCEKNKCDINR
jgi:hypothetical protein